MAAVRALRLKLGLTLAQSCSVLTHDEWIVCVAHTKNRESIEPSAAGVFTATVASVMRGVRVAALLHCSAPAVARPAACPYAPLDNSYSYAMGVLLLRVARHLAGEIASLLLLQQAACLATAATSGYVRNGFINWLNVTFIELQPLHYHCRRQV